MLNLLQQTLDNYTYSYNKDYINKIYTEGAKHAAYLASKTLRKVHRKLGYVDR